MCTALLKKVYGRADAPGEEKDMTDGKRCGPTLLHRTGLDSRELSNLQLGRHEMN